MLKIQRARRNNVQISKCSSRAEEKWTLHISADCRQSSGTQREVHHKQNQDTQATATVDDEHGYFLIGHVCNERRELTPGSESTQSRGKSYKFFQKAPRMMQNMYPQSNQALRDTRETATAELHSFLCDPTRAPVAAQQQARKQPSKNCTCESPRSAAKCVQCVPRSACSWNVHHSVDELKHTRVHEQRLLELMLHVHRDSTRRPVFLSRPGLAIEPHKLSASSSLFKVCDAVETLIEMLRQFVTQLLQVRDAF